MSGKTMVEPIAGAAAHVATLDAQSFPRECSQHDPPSSRVRTRRNLWVEHCRQFLRFHRRPVNNMLHLLTTPLGLFGAMSLIQSARLSAAVGLSVLYVVSLLWMVPLGVCAVTAGVLAGLLAASVGISLSWPVAIAMVVLGYLGQDLAHGFAGEKTLQGSYAGQRGSLRRLLEHTWLLLPLVLTIAGRRRQSPLRILVARKAVLATRLRSEQQTRDLHAIRAFVHETDPNPTQSSHWWQHELPAAAAEAFARLSHDRDLTSMLRRFHGPGYRVEPVLGMNELYVTGPPKQISSDTVFYMGHVDGPWAVFPGARLYRCMVAASPNAEVTTHYPMSGTGYDRPEGFRLEDGDAVAFDFNRELHYITRSAARLQSEPRVNLKLHFVAYPKALPWYGRLLAKLTTWYDIRARNLFLQTINPNRWFARVQAQWVLAWTKIFELTVRFVGWTNLAYVAVLAIVALLVRDPRWFLVGTSFVHYAIYVGTYRERNPVAFGFFRRDAMFFKAIAMTQLFGLYALHWGQDWVSLATVVTGFALATYATAVLGLSRSYFSAELGFDSPRRIRRFPYGAIPHPMVLGAVVGILGMGIASAMRTEYGWLLLAHVACYAVVLGQEVFGDRCQVFAEATPPASKS